MEEEFDGRGCEEDWMQFSQNSFILQNLENPLHLSFSLLLTQCVFSFPFHEQHSSNYIHPFPFQLIVPDVARFCSMSQPEEERCFKSSSHTLLPNSYVSIFVHRTEVVSHKLDIVQSAPFYACTLTHLHACTLDFHVIFSSANITLAYKSIHLCQLQHHSHFRSHLQTARI